MILLRPCQWQAATQREILPQEKTQLREREGEGTDDGSDNRAFSVRLNGKMEMSPQKHTF